MSIQVNKLMSIVTAFILLFTSIGVSTAFASEDTNNFTVESSEIKQDTDISDQIYDLTTDGTVPFEDLTDPRLNNSDRNFDVQPYIAPLIPLLATVTIRAGISFVARTSAGHVVKVSGHAASRAVERKITGAMIDKSLSQGTKYVDLLSGERVTWAENGNKVAVLLKKSTDVIDTVYDEDGKKLKWVKNNWQYIGDIN